MSCCLLLILGFALTGYLLPWDQKAYWATTVTINIAKSGPLGEQVAGLLQGGTTLGALTLLRWYAAHVFLLPAALIGFVIAHLYLMRRHGISGSVEPVAGPSKPFYPYHALKDTLVGAAVFALLLTFAVVFRAPLDPIADPSDATYVPRPEWYFLSLFQLLKYFHGPLEPLATMVIPGVVVGLLLLLPFLDRRPDRHFVKRPRVIASFGVIGLGIVVLMYLGLKDTPAHADPGNWGPLPVQDRSSFRTSAVRPAMWKGARRASSRRSAFDGIPSGSSRTRAIRDHQPRHPRSAAGRYERRPGAISAELHGEGSRGCSGAAGLGADAHASRRFWGRTARTAT